MSALVLAASAVLVDGRTWLEGGGLLVASGRVVRPLASPAAVRRAARSAAWVDVRPLVLTAGLVNAHAHLELSGLAGRMPRGEAFGSWVTRLLELRARRCSRGLARDAARGAQRCLRTGTTLVGDLDTTGAAERGLARPPLRVRLCREMLDAQDPLRTAPALARAGAPMPSSPRLRIGLAAHAPFSASPALLEGLGRLARLRRLPVSVHWSETPAEVEWLARGSGPLAPMLGPSPRRSGLDLLESAGLLGARTVLVHGNLPGRGEPRRLADAGATIVHCPGSHAWFERPAFPLRRYLRAGVRLALGTDSLASNEDLDLAREMALLRAAHPELSPERAWDMATEAGARALGWDGCLGVLRPLAAADVVAWSVEGGSRRRALEALTTGAARVERVWIAGRPVVGPQGA